MADLFKAYCSKVHDPRGTKADRRRIARRAMLALEPADENVWDWPTHAEISADDAADEELWERC